MIATAKQYRRRLTQADRQAEEREALDRARGNMSMSNFGQVIQQFSARGIPQADILPKENVFTYKAWRALGRQVRKGEHGVKISTWRPVGPKSEEPAADDKAGRRMLCVSSTVFHVSQTDSIAPSA